MKRNPIKERNGRHTLIGIMLAFTLVWLAVGSTANAQQWQTSNVPIYYNPAGSPYTQAQVEDAIEYASWIIDKRTGSQSYYAGISYAIDPSLDQAIVTWQAHPNGAPGAAATWRYTANGLMAKAKVYMDAAQIGSLAELIHTVAHELGHSLSMGHVAGVGELMNASADILFHHGLGHASIDSSEYNSGDRCFVELLPNGDLFVPDIGGMSAYLWQVGPYQWTLRHYYAGGSGECSTVSTIGADLIITDVQGYPGTSFSLVELESTGTDTWTLRYAE